MSKASFFFILLASIPGTLGMTFFMYLYGRLVGKETRVIHVFGSMLTGSASEVASSKAVLITGTIAHFSVGFFFALFYFLFWNWGVFDISVTKTGVLGVLSGILSVGVWYCYFRLHSNPPKISKGHYFIALIISHLVFAAVTVYIFHLLQPSPEFYHQLTGP